MTAPAEAEAPAAPGVIALRQDVAALHDQLADVQTELAATREQLAELVAFARNVEQLGEQLAPMLDGLATHPMARALGLGGR